jgi:hypothetical protein
MFIIRRQAKNHSAGCLAKQDKPGMNGNGLIGMSLFAIVLFLNGYRNYGSKCPASESVNYTICSVTPYRSMI